ncbi:hypothetical protein BHE74_00032691, partial [Ensete ventricosum]
MVDFDRHWSLSGGNDRFQSSVPISTVSSRFWAVSAEGERRRGRTWRSGTALPIPIRRVQAISSPRTGFLPTREKKHLPAWGEGTRR